MTDSASPEMPAPGPRMDRSRRPLSIALVVVIILVLLGTASAFVIAPRLCGLTEPQRHGLSCDIPLPAGAQFASQPNPGPQQSGVSAEAWSFKVSGVGEQVHTIAEFYQSHLHGAGWQCVQSSILADSPQYSQEMVLALNGNRVVSITVTRSPPDNVVQLLILVGSYPHAAPGGC